MQTNHSKMEDAINSALARDILLRAEREIENFPSRAPLFLNSHARPRGRPNFIRGSRALFPCFLGPFNLQFSLKLKRIVIWKRAPSAYLICEVEWR